MILMIPFALLRKGFGVISGIKATAGFLYIIANKTTIAIMMITPAKLFIWKKTGINGKATTQMNVPTKIYGIRFPIGDLVLSDKAPNIGSKIRAARLSVFLTKSSAVTEAVGLSMKRMSLIPIAII